MFINDPDSLKNDLTVVSSNPNVQVTGNSIRISGSFGSHGTLNFSLSCTHDFLTVNPSYTVTVAPCPINPSNTFTPNGDGINDTWEIPDLANFSKCEVDIFTRNGSRVFHSTGYGKAWDGTFNRTRLPAGVYYYIIKPNEPGYNTISGNVTIIR
jgi:gliding motility-associated-like protein